MIGKLNNCCFCLPLRRGLLAWAYFVIILYCCTIIASFFGIYNKEYFDDGISLVKGILLVTAFLNFIFYIVLIFALHKKCRRLLSIFYWYNVAMLTLFIIQALSYAPTRAYNTFSSKVQLYLDEYMSVMPITILFQFYIVIVVRSLMLDIEDCKYRLSRNNEEQQSRFV